MALKTQKMHVRIFLIKWSLNCVVLTSSIQTQSAILFGQHHYQRINTLPNPDSVSYVKQW